MKVSRWLTPLLSAVVLIEAGSMTAQAVEPGSPARLIDREFVTLIALRDELDGPAKTKFSLSKEELKGLGQFYKSEAAKLIWVDEDGLAPKASESLKTVFKRADTFGLEPRDYAIVDGASFKTFSGPPSKWLADTELRMSLAAINYANQAQTGRLVPTSIDKEFLDLKPVHPETGAILSGLAKADGHIADYLEGYNPQHPQFKRLKEKLAETRSAVKSGSIPVRIPEGPSLGPNTYHPQIATVRERLAVPVPASAPNGNPAEYYDDALAEAVRVFQETKGPEAGRDHRAQYARGA